MVVVVMDLQLTELVEAVVLVLLVKMVLLLKVVMEEMV
jgi:hypothetical protein